MARKDTETVRSKRHKELDEVYSARNPDLELNAVRGTADDDGERKEISIEFKDGAYVLNANNVPLDRESGLALSKAGSRIAQALS